MPFWSSAGINISDKVPKLGASEEKPVPLSLSLANSQLPSLKLGHGLAPRGAGWGCKEAWGASQEDAPGLS